MVDADEEMEGGRAEVIDPEGLNTPTLPPSVGLFPVIHGLKKNIGVREMRVAK